MIYEPLLKDALTTFPYLVLRNTNAVLIQNDSEVAVTIGKHTPLGNIINNKSDGGLVKIDELEAYHLVAQPAKNLSESRLLIKCLLANTENAAVESPESRKNSSMIYVTAGKPRVACSLRFLVQA